ncbi:Alpha/gamma-adaptin-binding protein p34 [Penicillium capsulatum]|uniref:Alpha/gamma-adaptin-binding protein p34 n=1 Tax=Penicillium capsulatum TaxID=69766 RepID=A0A9W9HR25_9EURO|nr:Alpha/gamma-adaptin-binding protein p34 [Penicillium capsulatum]KAJ6105417.1 Alpha/gamma-adaptin-binding protein p34 [Penicillium capsulatum]
MMSSADQGPTPTPKPKSKAIANPRRLLILSPPSQSVAIIPSLLHALTGVPVHDPPQQETETSPAPTDQPTGTESARTRTSFAGYTTHSPLDLDTKYYTAEIPVWVDEVPLSPETAPSSNAETTPAESTATQWRTEFLSAEADIVRDAVGALVVSVHSPADTDASAGGTDPADRADVRAIRDLMRDIGAVKQRIDEERGGVGDVPGIFVLVGARKAAPRAGSVQSRGATGLELGEEGDLANELSDTPFSVGWWEDQLFDMGLFGWEVLEWDPHDTSTGKTRNQFGEYEGMPRLKEVLETHDWSASSGLQDPDVDPEIDFESDDDLERELLGLSSSADTPGFGHEVHELEREMLGLRMAIESGGGDGEVDEDEKDEELKVESMDALMLRMQAIRDMGSDLPEGERKKFAAKAVQDIMRQL